jgi:hypothetical protein
MRDEMTITSNIEKWDEEGYYLGDFTKRWPDKEWCCSMASLPRKLLSQTSRIINIIRYPLDNPPQREYFSPTKWYIGRITTYYSEIGMLPFIPDVYGVEGNGVEGDEKGTENR